MVEAKQALEKTNENLDCKYVKIREEAFEKIDQGIAECKTKISFKTDASLAAVDYLVNYLHAHGYAVNYMVRLGWFKIKGYTVTISWDKEAFVW